MNETETYPALTVLINARSRAADALRAAGAHVLAAAYTNGSTTWSFVLASDELLDEPAEPDEVARLRDLLWEAGIGYVGSDSVEVSA